MKFERVKGNVPVFSEDYDGRDRTIFGGTEQSNDINQQFTPEFIKGWGIVGKNEFPTLQDFNALGFTHSALIGYLYQSGVAQWVAGADYYTGSIAVQGVDLYVAIQDKPTSQPSSLQGWRLVSPALLNTTGNSTSAPMTQKAVTDALAKKWDIQATTGSGNIARMSEVQKKWDIQQTVGSGKVMREGAYGFGGRSTNITSSDIFERNLPNGLYYITAGWDAEHNKYLPAHWKDGAGASYVHTISHSNNYEYQIAIIKKATGSKEACVIKREGGTWKRGDIIYDEANTRKDKNNVLHSGTRTPINTLNVSDMAQDVVNRDDMTVTSGAVYRGLAKKWDIQTTTGSGNVARMSEVEKKITGGSVVQKTGTSTTNVMSQKAFTDLSFGIGQKWVDVTSQRLVGTTYTNNTGKPIYISYTSESEEFDSGWVNLFVDSVKADVDQQNRGSYRSVKLRAVVPVGNTYKIEGGRTNKYLWSELR